MSEEKDALAGAAPGTEAATPPAPSAKKGKAKSVIVYISIMFVVALLLIVLSFFMQQRNHDALMRGISSTGLTAQTIVELELENAALEDEVSDLQTKLLEEKAIREALEEELSQAAGSRDQREALEWLMTIKLLYESGEIDRAKNLIEEFRASKLIDALPAESVLPDTPSPHELYEEMVLTLS